MFLETADTLYEVLAILGICFIAICGVATVKAKKTSCFKCPCMSVDDAASDGGIENPSDVLPIVKIRKDVGRSGGRSNTWPWQSKRPPASVESLEGTLEIRGHGSSSVIFSSNSLCLKVVKDDEESNGGHQFKGCVEVYDGEEEEEEDAEKEMEGSRMDDIQSIVSDFEEEVLKGVEALDSSAEGMSDSLKNVAGSLRRDFGELGEGHSKVKWVVGEEEGSDCQDAVEMTDDEGDVALIISDDDLEDDKQSKKDLVPLPDIFVTEPKNESEPLDSPALPIHPRSSSIRKYHYSMTKEEILCCSSNTSSLALESPWLGSFSDEELDLHLRRAFPGSLDPYPDQDQRMSALRPFMLYRYSISLEEVQYPYHTLSRSVPGALLPLPLTAADDEDSEVFYDALSTIGSTRSSLMEPQMEGQNRNSLAVHVPGRRSTYFSTSSDKSCRTVRRCSSLHDLI